MSKDVSTDHLTAQFSAVLEPTETLRETGTLRERPHEKTRIPWKDGRFLAWDVPALILLLIRMWMDRRLIGVSCKRGRN